jgi:N-acetyl sugar amidotransferase
MEVVEVFPQETRHDYQMCSLGIMDTIGDPDVSFDKKGVCNYYYEYKEKAKIRLVDPNESSRKVAEIVEAIKNSGRRKMYDCVIGVSGGVDSTYTAYKVKEELGLKPLAIHFDNGWNSELAVSNIEKVLKNLEIDLYTYVVNWEEFKDIQLSFLKASTPDGEIPTDHAILAILYRIAAEQNIKYIVTGNNFRTEGVMPPSWAYGHIDWKYIKSVQKLFGKSKIRTFPHLTLSRFLHFTFIKRIQLVSILNYFEYDRPQAMELLQQKLGWNYYGGKHHESVYTKFYQSYILPRKFNIDKRKLHLSTLIFAGLMDRETALAKMTEPAYPLTEVNQDREFVIKKFGLTDAEFESIMNAPPKSFHNYPNSFAIHKKFRSILAYLRRKGLYYS